MNHGKRRSNTGGPVKSNQLLSLHEQFERCDAGLNGVTMTYQEKVEVIMVNDAMRGCMEGWHMRPIVCPGSSTRW